MSGGLHWTKPAEIKAQVRRLWDSGKLLSAMAADEEIFPRRLILKGPTSRELADEFVAVRDWIAALRKGEAHGYRIKPREVNHRVLGLNKVPDEVWVDSLDAALGLIGKRPEAERFAAVLAETRLRQPELIPWLAQRPNKALELTESWSLLLDIVAWLHVHPRPDIYLRQVDLPGVHSKFIEVHRGVLAELLDRVLPPECIQADSTGLAGFCRRYGFRDKPIRVRFRLLDSNLDIFPGGGDQDIKVTQEIFARLTLPVRRVFMTENEINFLAFPPVEDGMVIFGAGYGFEMLAEAHWLHDCAVYYWGDIDTHGFAILNQLRARMPHAQSFLMDRQTLLDHRRHWGIESDPERRDLPRLTPSEAELYDDLRQNRLNPQLRLEQEKIGFSWIERALEILHSDKGTSSCS